MSRVLICSPIKTGNSKLTESFMAILNPMMQRNPLHTIGIYLDCSAIKGVESKTPWSKVAVARNIMLENIQLGSWDYLLWIDADIVRCPAKLPSLLIKANPRGITSPLVLIDDGTENVYDWAANIMLGKDGIEPENRWNVKGRNIQNKYPYWPDESYLSGPIKMDCTGTITMVPTEVYRRGARYEDHPAFTDHYPICKKMRDMGGKVMVIPSIVAYHADLPKFGESWH